MLKRNLSRRRFLMFGLAGASLFWGMGLSKLSSSASDVLIYLSEFSAIEGAHINDLIVVCELPPVQVEAALTELHKCSLICCEGQGDRRTLLLNPLAYLFLSPLNPGS